MSVSDSSLYGIGTDVLQIARMEKSLQRASFVQRVFGPEEQALLASLGPGRRAQTAAANFAAKEAFLKAAGRGLGGFSLCEIQALRRESGAPYYQFSGAVARWVSLGGLTAHLSLSHEGGLALAFAVLEQ